MKIKSTLLLIASLTAVCTAQWVTEYEYKKDDCKGDVMRFEAVIPNSCVLGESVFSSEVQNVMTCQNGSAVVTQYDSSTDCTGTPLQTVYGQDDKCMTYPNTDEGVEINCENDFDAKGAIAGNHGRYLVIEEYSGTSCGSENIFRISGYKIDKKTKTICGGTGTTFNQIVCQDDNSVKFYSSCDSTCDEGCQLTISVAPGQCATWQDHSISAYCQNGATQMAVSSLLLFIITILLFF